jgi:hypothetical protein
MTGKEVVTKRPEMRALRAEQTANEIYASRSEMLTIRSIKTVEIERPAE